MVSPPSHCKTVGSVGGRAHARTSWSGRARHVPERRSYGDSHCLSRTAHQQTRRSAAPQVTAMQRHRLPKLIVPSPAAGMPGPADGTIGPGGTCPPGGSVVVTAGRVPHRSWR
jgi:hypothetical protein